MFHSLCINIIYFSVKCFTSKNIFIYICKAQSRVNYLFWYFPDYIYVYASHLIYYIRTFWIDYTCTFIRDSTTQCFICWALMEINGWYHLTDINNIDIQISIDIQTYINNIDNIKWKLILYLLFTFHSFYGKLKMQIIKN